jgi:hypothetical protein
MRKRKISKIYKNLSLRCSAKDCMFYASSFGGTPKELDSLQWCSTHHDDLHNGKILITKKGLKVKWNPEKHSYVLI